MKKVLVIAVHPDDETLGCGGTILKHIHEGDKVSCVFVTSGNEYQKEVVNNVVKAYGFESVHYLDVPELTLTDSSLNDLIPSLATVIKEVKPDTLYIPNRSDVHSDHRITFEACLPFTKQFRFPFVKEIYMMEVSSETDFVPAITSLAFVPNTFVDITPFMGRKMEIMSLYDSEVMDDVYPRSNSSIEAMSRYRGSRIGVKYAESFVQLMRIK